MTVLISRRLVLSSKFSQSPSAGYASTPTSHVVTPGTGEGAFPSDLLSLEAYENTAVTNIHKEDKGFMVLAADVFDVPIKKDLLHHVVRWQLEKRHRGLNAYSILLHDTLVMSRDAVCRIVERVHTPINL